MAASNLPHIFDSSVVVRLNRRLPSRRIATAALKPALSMVPLLLAWMVSLLPTLPGGVPQASKASG